MIASMLLLLVGSIMRCQQRPDAPPKEVIEATEDTSRQVTGQDPAPEIKRIEPADSAETPDSAMQAHMERQCFETLTKMADGGKVYATDADGKRIPKAFTRFDDYRLSSSTTRSTPRTTTPTTSKASHSTSTSTAGKSKISRKPPNPSPELTVTGPVSRRH